VRSGTGVSCAGALPLPHLPRVGVPPLPPAHAGSALFPPQTHGSRRGLRSVARSARYPHLRPASYKIRVSTRSVQKKVAHGVSRGNAAARTSSPRSGRKNNITKVCTTRSGCADGHRQILPPPSSHPITRNSARAGDSAFGRRKNDISLRRTGGNLGDTVGVATLPPALAGFALVSLHSHGSRRGLCSVARSAR